jgi:hypothetical protein
MLGRLRWEDLLSPQAGDQLEQHRERSSQKKKYMIIKEDT